MPKLAGIFYAETSSDVGIGSTKQERSQRLNWFAIYLDSQDVLLKALDADGLPTTISKVVSAKEFFTDFTPDTDHFKSRILPLLTSAQQKIRDADGKVTNLEGDEVTVFKALILDEEHIPGASKEERKALPMTMLGELPDFQSVAQEYKRLLNEESITSRRDGRYDEAIDFYNTMLRSNPSDDHVYFNVARVLFDKKDYRGCRKYLQLATEHDPGFDEARKFISYLDKKFPESNDELRNHLRFQFHIPQPCSIEIEGRSFDAEIIDISAQGAQIQTQNGARQSMRAGNVIKLSSSSPLLSLINSGTKGKIVWQADARCGALFMESLNTALPSFQKLVAYSRLV